MYFVTPFKTQLTKAVVFQLEKRTQEAIKAKTPYLTIRGPLCVQSGDALLSHGETPHYHRHYGILLLSSEWSQVELPHYGRQNIPF